MHRELGARRDDRSCGKEAPRIDCACRAPKMPMMIFAFGTLGSSIPVSPARESAANVPHERRRESAKRKERHPSAPSPAQDGDLRARHANARSTDLKNRCLITARRWKTNDRPSESPPLTWPSSDEGCAAQEPITCGEKRDLH